MVNLDLGGLVIEQKTCCSPYKKSRLNVGFPNDMKTNY